MLFATFSRLTRTSGASGTDGEKNRLAASPRHAARSVQRGRVSVTFMRGLHDAQPRKVRGVRNGTKPPGQDLRRRVAQRARSVARTRRALPLSYRDLGSKISTGLPDGSSMSN